LKKWRYIWPFLLALVVWFFNTDWVVIPSLQNRAFCIWGANLYDLSWLIPPLSLFQIFIAICVVSTLDLLFWYFFLIWLRDLIFRTIVQKQATQEAAELGREVKSALNSTGLMDRIIDWLHRWLHWSTSDTNPIVTRLKRLGYGGLFSFSAIPETGTRVAAIFICSMSKSIKGMLFVLLGNLVKNSLMVFAVWGPVSKMSPGAQIIVLSALFLLLLFFILRKSKKT